MGRPIRRPCKRRAGEPAARVLSGTVARRPDAALVDRHFVQVAAPPTGHGPRVDTVVRGAVLSGGARGAGGVSGKTQVRQNRSRYLAARLRLRRGRRADGQGRAGRPGARGGARARTRHQLLRHGADVRQRRERAQSRPRAEGAEARCVCRHEGAAAADRTGPDRRGDRRLARGQPQAAAARRVDLFQFHNAIVETT